MSDNTPAQRLFLDDAAHALCEYLEIVITQIAHDDNGSGTTHRIKASQALEHVEYAKRRPAEFLEFMEALRAHNKEIKELDKLNLSTSPWLPRNTK